MMNPNLQKLQRPTVDPPHNLFVESRQYQIRQAANATFGKDPNTGRVSGVGQTGRTGVSNADILNYSSMQEGAKLLKDL